MDHPPQNLENDAIRCYNTANTLIAQMDGHIKDANEKKPLDAGRRADVQKVQAAVHALEGEKGKLQHILQTFNGLHPNNTPANQKFIKDVSDAIAQLNLAIKSGNTMKVMTAAFHHG